MVRARQMAEDRSHLLGPPSSVSSACALSTLSARQGSARHCQGLTRPLQPPSRPPPVQVPRLCTAPRLGAHGGWKHPCSPSSRDAPGPLLSVPESTQRPQPTVMTPRPAHTIPQCVCRPSLRLVWGPLSDQTQAETLGGRGGDSVCHQTGQIAHVR